MIKVLRDIKHVQKKVIQSTRESFLNNKSNIPIKKPSLLGGEGKWGEALRHRRSGRRRRL